MAALSRLRRDSSRHSAGGLVWLVGSGGDGDVGCLRWAAGLKHTWCELPGLCNQGSAPRRAGSHGRRIMTGDKLETNHLGLKSALGLCYPSVRLSPGSPGAPIKHSGEKHRWSEAESRYMMCSCWSRSVFRKAAYVCQGCEDGLVM